jgi:hypothetical protein
VLVQQLEHLCRPNRLRSRSRNPVRWQESQHDVSQEWQRPLWMRANQLCRSQHAEEGRPQLAQDEQPQPATRGAGTGVTGPASGSPPTRQAAVKSNEVVVTAGLHPWRKELEQDRMVSIVLAGIPALAGLPRTRRMPEVRYLRHCRYFPRIRQKQSFGTIFRKLLNFRTKKAKAGPAKQSCPCDFATYDPRNKVLLWAEKRSFVVGWSPDQVTAPTVSLLFGPDTELCCGLVS